MFWVMKKLFEISKDIIWTKSSPEANDQPRVSTLADL